MMMTPEEIVGLLQNIARQQVYISQLESEIARLKENK